MSKKIKSDDSPSSAAEQVGGNEDLIREILPYLPGRSLVRFKSVSKQWLSLIADPHFCLRHTLIRRNPSSFLPSGLFFYNSLSDSRQIESVSLSRIGERIPSLLQPEPLSDDSIKLIQSCNGLDFFRLVSPSRRIKLYSVRNSTTRQYKLIPLPNLTPNPNESIVDCNLAFDPSKSPHYKIVCVKGVRYQPLELLIYSSETGEWRTTDVTINNRSWIQFENGVYWNGGIHWIRNNIRLECYRFDVEAESLTILPMPTKPQEADDAYFRHFGEFNGCLHLVYIRNRTAKRFNVLEMDKETLKWFVKYRVHISRLTTPFPEVVVKGRSERFGCEESQYAFSILCVVRGEKEEDSALVMTIPGKVISYNFKSKKAEVLTELPSKVVDISNFHYISAYPFVATLYPL